MLVITRKVNQALYIGTSKVVVLGVERDRVKLGILADDGVQILREELLERVLNVIEGKVAS